MKRRGEQQMPQPTSLALSKRQACLNPVARCITNNLGAYSVVKVVGLGERRGK